MKKRILALAVVMICISVLATTTLAYFTDFGTARNIITSGGIDIEVVEQQMIDGTLQPWVNSPIPVMPASTVSKIVSVKSMQQPAWIRMNYTLTVYDADGKEMNIEADELEKVIVINPDNSNWTEKGGWWYYNTAVNTGEATSPLFEEVVFSGPHMDNKYQNATVIIDVTAQAVQQANNGAVIMEANWPED